MKKERGITIIAVIITVIVLIILSGVSIAMLLGDNGIIEKAEEAKFTTEISTFYEEYNTYLLGKYVSTLSSYDKITLNADNREIESDGIMPIKKIMPSMKEEYYLERIKVEKGEWIYSNFTSKETEIIKKIINKEHTEPGNPDKPEDTDEKYIQTGVNKPVPPVDEDVWNNTSVITKVLPIVFDETGGYKTVTDFKKEWYNYQEQTSDTTSGGTSKWANIMTLDGSMWVWIPRYAYKITSGAHSKIKISQWQERDSNRLNKEEAGTIEIKFLKEDTNEFWDGTTGETLTDDPSKITYTDDGTKIYQNEWFVSQSFKFNDKQLKGFWVAKYEASSLIGNGNNMLDDDVLATKHLQSVPAKQSWRYIDTKNMFGNCIFMGTADNDHYGFKKNTNTHLMKNDEWGAVAYLAHSKYGRNKTAISPNTSSQYITGTGGPLASTTGNYYGIFDMVGGASDAVAAINYIDKEAMENKEENIDIDEYFNIYTDYDEKTKGDAIYETSIQKSTASSWFKGLSWLVDKSETRMSRGGKFEKYKNGGEENPSIFSFYRYKKDIYQVEFVSYRPTITFY